MSLQVFLQAQLLGAEEFLAAPSIPGQDMRRISSGRSAWLSLICEVLPRALLSELKLSQHAAWFEQCGTVLSGSGAKKKFRARTSFLKQRLKPSGELSHGTLHLHWVSTENLGAWPIARKRLDDALSQELRAAAAVSAAEQSISSLLKKDSGKRRTYFAEFGEKSASCDPRWAGRSDRPRASSLGRGPVFVAAQGARRKGRRRHSVSAPFRDGRRRRYAPVRWNELARRSEGNPHWGILRGDVDQFASRLQRATTIEEHIHLSVLFKEFFAGELALLCTLPEFWRKVTILYRGGDDFAVVGSWDALILLARELQRLFEKFAEQNLQSFAGVEGKTISMALAIAPDADTPLAAVFEEAGVRSAQRPRQPNRAVLSVRANARMEAAERCRGAEEQGCSRLVRDFGFPPDYINDLGVGLSRIVFGARGAARRSRLRVDKPWRTYMRVSRVIPQARGKELNKSAEHDNHASAGQSRQLV